MVVDVANAIDLSWESEDIPDTDVLYMRVHWRQLDEDGVLIPGAFKDIGGGMSTDWDKYSNPDQTRARAADPTANAVIAMSVGEVRTVPGQIVIHTPSLEFNNRAHTDVIGEKKKNPEVRLKFTRIYRVVIPYAGQHT